MSAKNLNNLYGKLAQGGVRLTHQYQFNFAGIGNTTYGNHSIQGLTGGSANKRKIKDILSDITIWADGASIPSKTQNTTEIMYLGYPLVVPTNMTMSQDLQLNIKCDADMFLHGAFVKLADNHSNPLVNENELGNFGGTKSVNDKDVKGVLSLYDEEFNNVQMNYYLHGIMVTDVGEVAFSNGTPDIATFSVSFKYQYWSSENI
jgi:hypothetical protein